MEKRYYTTACPGCAEKLDRMYWMDEVPESERAGKCPWCMRYVRVQQYAYSPRRKRRRAPQAGGGERRRAGG